MSESESEPDEEELSEEEESSTSECFAPDTAPLCLPVIKGGMFSYHKLDSGDDLEVLFLFSPSLVFGSLTCWFSTKSGIDSSELLSSESLLLLLSLPLPLSLLDRLIGCKLFERSLNVSMLQDAGAGVAI